MTMIATDLLNTRESARRIRVEPTTQVGGSILQTNVQKALEQLDALISGASTTITTSPATLPPEVTEVFFNGAGAVTATLPTVAAWAAANPGENAELFLKDISGAAATNNITVNRAGSNTIDGLTTFAITTNYGSYRLRITPAGQWTFAG